MKIGIVVYHHDAGYKGGVTSYILGLLSGLQNMDEPHHYILFTSTKNDAFFRDFLKSKNIDQGRFEVVNADQAGLQTSGHQFMVRVLNYLGDNYGFLPIVRSLIWPLYRFVWRKLFSFIDSFRCDAVYVPYGFLLYIKSPRVVSLHDIQHIHYPQFFIPRIINHRRVFYNKIAQTVEILQASSEYIKQDFTEYFKIPSGKIAVIRDGVDDFFYKIPTPETLTVTKVKYNLPDRFVFYPAQHWPHKDHLTLIRAAELLFKNEGVKVHFVFTGNTNKDLPELYEYIAKSPVQDAIHLVGSITRDELLAMYHLAYLTAMPSLHESNSLVIMEALAAGSAVVASDIEPNKELNSNGALTLFKTGDSTACAQALNSLLKDPTIRTEKVALGKELAKEFPWEKTARKYIQVFEELSKKK